jgi:hypothetical protein
MLVVKKEERSTEVRIKDERTKGDRKDRRKRSHKRRHKVLIRVIGNVALGLIAFCSPTRNITLEFFATPSC